MKQLLPAYKEAAPLMDVQLIPYGKATTYTNPDGSYRFDCQHGHLECEANTYHACVIEVVQDALARLEVVTCMIRDNHLPKEAFHKVSHTGVRGPLMRINETINANTFKLILNVNTYHKNVINKKLVEKSKRVIKTINCLIQLCGCVRE